MSSISIATGLLNDFTAVKVKELFEERPWMVGKKFLLLTKQIEVEEYINKCIANELCTLDVETTGLNTRLDPDGNPYIKLIGICLSCGPDEGAYIPIAHEDKELNVPLSFVLKEVARLVANCRCIYHNFKYDGQVLRNHGIIIEDEEKYEDTLLLAAVYDASMKKKGLKDLSEGLLGRPMLEISELGVKTGKKGAVALELVPPQKAVYYGASDGMNTYALYQFLKAKIDEQDPTGKTGPWAIYKIEKRCQLVTMEMERNYVRIDKAYLEQVRIDVIDRMKKLIQGVYDLVGREFDLNSPKQLGTILFEEMSIPYPKGEEKTASGQYGTSEEVLVKLQGKYPIIDMILTYRGYGKILSTYIENFIKNADENDEVKFQLNQVRADTGRFSSTGGKGLDMDGYSGVNCQNIPKFDEKDPNSVDLRKALIARPGFKLVSIDYSGEELRIAANLSREPKWLEEFLHGTGDLHTVTAKIITGKDKVDKKERGIGKCVAKGTRIASSRGWVPIEELEAGDKVVTHNGLLKEIESVHQMGIKPAVSIETKAGHRITCGVNHRFLTTSGKWVKAKDLKEGDAVTTISCDAQNPKNNYKVNFNFWSKGEDESQSSEFPFIEMGPLWARLFGYILGDGHMHPNYVGMVCSELYNDVKEDAVKVAEKLGLPTSAVLRTRKGAKNALWTINFGSTILARFFRSIGFRGRHGKIFRIPKWIFESPKEVSREFLKGLFETDGTVDPCLVSVCTKDRDLAGDVQLLLASFGIRAYIRTKPSKKYNRDYYNIEFGRLGADIFEREIGFVSKNKRDRLSTLTGKKHHPGSSPRQNWYTEIKKVEQCGNRELWDLTVGEDHTYVAEGLVTHNTLNFLTLYGGGAGGFAAQAKIPYETAQKMIANFFRDYTGIKRWIATESAQSRKRGYSKTAFGRRRPLTEFYNSPEKVIQAKGDRCAVNSCVQGSGSDVIKIALYRVWKWVRDNNLQDDIRILLPVHDEILFEVKEDKLDAYIPELCEKMKLKDIIKKLGWAVPLEVDAEYGDSFHADHNYWEERQQLTEEKKEVVPEKVQEEGQTPAPVAPEKAAPVEEMAKVSLVGSDTQETVSSTANNETQQYYCNVTVKSALTGGAEAREDIKRVLEKSGGHRDSSPIFKDAHIKEGIDSNGYFNYLLDIDSIAARQLGYILDLLISTGDNVFIGPKYKIRLLNREGEVYHKTTEEVSVDAFLALCFNHNI